jgi:hypothetical protein
MHTKNFSQYLWGIECRICLKKECFVTLRLGGDTTAVMSTKTLQRELLGLCKNTELLIKKFVLKNSINSVHLNGILTKLVTQFFTWV